MTRAADPSADRRPPESDEASLLMALRTGDDEAFEHLVRSHGGRMLAVARRILGNEEDARDALQEAFLSAFRAIERFEGHAKLSTWLHQIVVNTSLMKLRTRRRHPEESIGPLLPEFLEDGHQAHPSGDWTDRADVAIEREETRAFLRQSIDRLPESYRTVVLLRDIEELDTDTTARLLGVSQNVVKTRLHRARQALKTILDGRFSGSSLS